MAHVLGAIFCQWSKGSKEWKSKEKHYVSGDAILKQTVDPIRDMQ